MKKKTQPVRTKFDTKAVEEFGLWIENTKKREEDFKNGRKPRDKVDHHNA